MTLVALVRISRSALTKAIRPMEEEVGGQLVYRDGEGTLLTEIGLTIRGEFEEIVLSEMRARAGR